MGTVQRETAFEDVVPLRPEEEEQRRALLGEMKKSIKSSRIRESGTRGPCEYVKGVGLLFSAPHEVAQLRDGEEKVAERGTGDLAFALAGITGASALATVGLQSGDPNWDLNHPYVNTARGLAGTAPIIDLHMMRPRGPDICIGLGPEPALSEGLWRPLLEEAVESGLRASVNWPFGANARTVTGQLQRLGHAAVQVELSWECFDEGHPAMLRAWTTLARAATRLAVPPAAD
jgi:hypothetical protein